MTTIYLSWFFIWNWNRKHGLNCHRMKPALFSVLCEIKEKTGKWATSIQHFPKTAQAPSRGLHTHATTLWHHTYTHTAIFTGAITPSHWLPQNQNNNKKTLPLHLLLNANTALARYSFGTSGMTRKTEYDIPALPASSTRSSSLHILPTSRSCKAGLVGRWVRSSSCLLFTARPTPLQEIIAHNKQQHSVACILLLCETTFGTLESTCGMFYKPHNKTERHARSMRRLLAVQYIRQWVSLLTYSRDIVDTVSGQSPFNIVSASLDQ